MGMVIYLPCESKELLECLIVYHTGLLPAIYLTAFSPLPL